MVRILGAGLAGLTAAIKLAQAGVSVTVLEKRDFVGRAVDGHQAIRNYEHNHDQIEYFRQNGIKIDHAKPIHNIIKHAPSGKSMTIQSEGKNPIFYSLKRGPGEISLEHQLYRQALDLNADVVFNSSSDLASTDADIIATGGLHNNIWAYGSVYADANVDRETILFFMNNEYCPKGYIYAIPYENEITIAATTFEIGCPLPKLFQNFIKENPVIRDALNGATFLNHTSGFEYANIPKTAVINGKKIIGSAAGFIDPSRGFGIKYSLLSGMLAAKSIKENSDYDILWKSAFEKELLDGFKRRLLLERMSNEDYEKFIMNEKISIKQYDKFPDFMRNELLKLSVLFELEKRRKKYNLKDAFKIEKGR